MLGAPKRRWVRTGVGGAPVAGRVHPEPLGTARFQNVGRPFGGALGVGVKRHAAPESTVQDFLHGVFFNVINQDSTRIDGRLVPHRFHDQSGSFLFVFEVWGVHEDERLVLGPRSRGVLPGRAARFWSSC